MEIERTFTVAANANHVWDLVGKRFHDVASWASMINGSHSLATARGKSGMQDRVCDTSQGIFKEEVTRFDNTQRVLSYLAYEGLPGFVKQGGSTWSVASLAPNRAEVHLKMQFDLTPIANVLMGWMLKRQMSRVADQVASDFKIYAETGVVSEAKRAAQAKYAKKAAAKAARQAA